jgi:SnoaL-like domain
MQMVDLTNRALDAMESGTIKSSSSLYSDDFTLTGPIPMPLNKNQYLDLMEKVTKGVPDWNFHRHDLRTEGQTVFVPVQITGTQNRTLPGLMPDMPDLPPTNRSFRLPPEVVQITFRGDKISRIHVDPVPGGGIPGMLEQLGVSIPVTGKPGEHPK